MKVAELSMSKLSASISKVSIEGLKLVILSADFLLNRIGLRKILLFVSSSFLLSSFVFDVADKMSLLSGSLCQSLFSHCSWNSGI